MIFIFFFIRNVYLCFIYEFQASPPFYKFSFSSHPVVMAAYNTFGLIDELDAIINSQLKLFFYLNIKSQFLFFNNKQYLSLKWKAIKMCLTI